MQGEIRCISDMIEIWYKNSSNGGESQIIVSCIVP